jgi:tetratricopeptide (TPR) repeat protein
MGKGVALHYLGKYKQAITVYNAIIADGGKSAQAWFNKACAYCMMGKDKETFDCLKKANELDPFNTSIHIETEESFDRLKGTPIFEKVVNEMRGTMNNLSPAKQDLNYIG